ncbi:hypothetical protein [Thiohalocapsa marina]|nr:hypothetical protein [Thiohalocapsa marina]
MHHSGLSGPTIAAVHGLDSGFPAGMTVAISNRPAGWNDNYRAKVVFGQ